MQHNFSKNSDSDSLDVILDNIFAVVNDEMGWSCEKPDNVEQNQSSSGNPDVDYIRKNIDEMKDSLEMLYTNIRNSASDKLDINNDIISLLSIKNEIDDLNRKVVDFQSSINAFTSANKSEIGQSDGDIQAINDIISIL